MVLPFCAPGSLCHMCQELGAILPDLDRAYFKIWPCLGPGSDRVSFSEQIYSTCALRVNSIPNILSMARHALFFKKSGALNVSDMAGRAGQGQNPGARDVPHKIISRTSSRYILSPIKLEILNFLLRMSGHLQSIQGQCSVVNPRLADVRTFLD
jgi:hypothetical protein